MTSKHTPGPWYPLYDTGAANRRIWITDSPFCSASSIPSGTTVVGEVWPVSPGNHHADNAHLICAAPDLLEALRIFAGLYDNQQNGLEVLPSDWAILRKIAAEAIRKATEGE